MGEINIGPRERLKRRMMGKVSLACAVVLAIALFAIDAPRVARLVVFLPLWFAGLGLFQARAGI
jgi:hypothetical protein